MTPPFAYTDIRKSSESSPVEVTVGINHGMFRGSDHFAIQGAVDYVHRLGGGTVRILPGTYVLRNSIFLPGQVNLIGSGAQTILQKHATSETKVDEDMDWYAWKVNVADAAPYAVGDGITVMSHVDNPGKAQQVSRHTVVRVEANTLHLDSQPRMNHWVSTEARLLSTHSLIEARCATDIRIADLRLEGNRPAAAHLDGNYGGAIFLHDCERVKIHNVGIHQWNGDAISFQICHDVHVEQCHIEYAATLALHPGSGSLRPIMRGNVIRNCTDGIFWCWGVKGGIAEDNEITDCSRHGISTGHRDTDNLIRNNKISGSGVCGIFFRPERSAWHTSHRVVLEENIVTVPAEPKTATGISLVRGVEDVVVRRNRVVVPAGAKERAIVVDPQAVRPILDANEIEQR